MLVIKIWPMIAVGLDCSFLKKSTRELLHPVARALQRSAKESKSFLLLFFKKEDPSEQLSGARRGIAALEFSLVAPILIVMVIGVFDICKALILRQEVLNTAHSISITASLLATQNLTVNGTTVAYASGTGGTTETTNGTTTLSYTQVEAVESDIFAEMPWLRSGVEKGQATVTLSGIEFSGLPNASCLPYSTGPNACSSWIPFVVWSVPYTPAVNYGPTFTSLKRACGPVSGVLNIYSSQTTPLTYATFMNTLRVGGITYPDPILVADVSYTYHPFFLKFITGPITFVASAYYPVRQIPFTSDSSPGGGQSGQLTYYDLTNADPNDHCAGYS